MRHVARVAGDVARIVRACPGVDDVDRRREILDAAADLLGAAAAHLRSGSELRAAIVVSDTAARLADREAFRVLAALAAELATLSRECEGRLRERARLAGGG